MAFPFLAFVAVVCRRRWRRRVSRTGRKASGQKQLVGLSVEQVRVSVQVVGEVFIHVG